MDLREKLILDQKVKYGEESICPKCFHHGICRGENNQPCFECNRFVDANGVTVQEWIPVTERLPKPNKLVLCWWQSGDGEREHYGFATFQSHGVWYVSNEGMPNVTHWMPLPEPPKEG